MSNFYLCKCGKTFYGFDNIVDHLTASTLFDTQRNHTIEYQDGERHVSNEILNNFILNNLTFLQQWMGFKILLEDKRSLG